ncbi:MAG: riboflavin synthase [Alphaproteobacteria bacterium]|nr:riboflavin synthase [Alphaproteobacteria bacterium]
MFTGIIQGQGKIQGIESLNNQARLRISPMFDITDYQQGESIAINGVCLTVEKYGKDWFEVYVSHETLKITNLGELKPASTVNLERAMLANSRFGGHIVSGHIDCTAKIESIRSEGISTVYRLKFPSEFSNMVVPKGSITLDGISLTVNKCDKNFLEVNIIPETKTTTTINNWKTGSKINTETDLIGKYVIKNLQNTTKQPITMNFLKENGF